jgi:hypothetical protein
MRRKEPYTPAEIKAWDEGFETAIAVARNELIGQIGLFQSPEMAARAIREVVAGMGDWLAYQQDQDSSPDVATGT